MKFIEILEDCLGRKAEKNFLPRQPGDVPETYADVDDLVNDVGFKPSTSIEKGVKGLWNGIWTITQKPNRKMLYRYLFMGRFVT